ncbi:MAG: peptidylprolyl isomerase [Vulcanimicrobiota bacterium]
MAEKNPKVIMETDKGTMTIELYSKEAPGTVDNFISLIEKGYYDGLAFHRVIPNFVIQGGCPKGDGTGGPGYTIKCETEGNPHKHLRGSLSMAHRGKDTGGSQFFICHSPQEHLDGVHTVFGRVVEGTDVIDKIKKGDKMKKLTVQK